MAPSDQTLRILVVIRRIPRGRVATYGQIAALAGLPRRARLVGRILNTEPLAADVPWHRVLNAAGRSSIQTDAGRREQLRRLAAEGVRLSPTGRVDLRRYRLKSDKIRRKGAA